MLAGRSHGVTGLPSVVPAWDDEPVGFIPAIREDPRMGSGIKYARSGEVHTGRWPDVAGD